MSDTYNALIIRFDNTIAIVIPLMQFFEFLFETRPYPEPSVIERSKDESNHLQRVNGLKLKWLG